MGLSLDNIDFISISNIFTQSEESWLEPVSSTPAPRSTEVQDNPIAEEELMTVTRLESEVRRRVGGWVILFDVCSKT